MAVNYCEKCGVRVDPQELARGSAVMFQGRNYCTKCKDAIAHLLPKSDGIVRRQASGVVAALRTAPPASSAGRPASPAARERRSSPPPSRRRTPGPASAPAGRDSRNVAPAMGSKSGIMALVEEEAEVPLPSGKGTLAAFLGAALGTGLLLLFSLLFLFFEGPSYSEVTQLATAEEEAKGELGKFTVGGESSSEGGGAQAGKLVGVLRDEMSKLIAQYGQRAENIEGDMAVEKIKSILGELENFELARSQEFDEKHKALLKKVRANIADLATRQRWTEIGSRTREYKVKKAEDRTESEWVSLFEPIGSQNGFLDEFSEPRFQETEYYQVAKRAGQELVQEWWDYFVKPRVEQMEEQDMPLDAAKYIERSYLRSVLRHYKDEPYVQVAITRMNSDYDASTPWKPVVADPGSFKGFEAAPSMDFPNKSRAIQLFDQLKLGGAELVEKVWNEANVNRWLAVEKTLQVTCERLDRAPSFEPIRFLAATFVAFLESNDFGYAFFITPDDEIMGDYEVSFEMMVLPGDDEPVGVYAGRYIPRATAQGSTWDHKVIMDFAAVNLVEVKARMGVDVNNWTVYHFRQKKGLFASNVGGRPYIYASPPRVPSASKERLLMMVQGWGEVRIRNLQYKNLDRE